MCEEFGKQSKAVAFDDPGGFEAGFVIGKAFFGSEAGHADIDAWELGFAGGVEVFDFAMARGSRVEEDDVNVVVMAGFGGGAGAKLAESAAFDSGFCWRRNGHLCGERMLARLERAWKVICGRLLTIDD